MVPTSNNWKDERPVLLPAPQDFQGKLIEVQAFAYGDTSKECFVGCVVTNGSGTMAQGITYSGSAFVIPASGNKPTITIRTGTTRKFHSLQISGVWYWVADLT